MRGNQLQPGVDAQNRDEAVRVGVVVAAVAGVHEDGQPVRLAHLVDFEAAEVVDLEALNVGVQLDTVQAQLPQMMVVTDKVGTVRVERAEPEEAAARRGDLGGDKLVDVPHLMRRGGDRFHDEAVDAAGVCAAEQFFRRAAAGGVGSVNVPMPAAARAAIFAG